MPTTKPLDLEKLVRVPNVYGYDISPDVWIAVAVWDKYGQLGIISCQRAVTKNWEGFDLWECRIFLLADAFLRRLAHVGIPCIWKEIRREYNNPANKGESRLLAVRTMH